MDRYVTVNQGEVFYMTEALARLEGLERGPAGNISLAAAFAIAAEMDKDQTLVVQETEYTGAGKHVQAQLSFARENGIDVRLGDPREEKAGESIVLPQHAEQIGVRNFDLQELTRSYLQRSVEFARELSRQRGEAGSLRLDEADRAFLAAETRRSPEQIDTLLAELKIGPEA
jgi:hypothetical protein